jgi:imidazolonepropionase
MSPAEALAACTVNAAQILGRSDSHGRLAPGFDANVVLIDAPDWRHLAYHVGGDLVSLVVKDGDVVWER